MPGHPTILPSTIAPWMLVPFVRLWYAASGCTYAPAEPLVVCSAGPTRCAWGFAPWVSRWDVPASVIVSLRGHASAEEANFTVARRPRESDEYTMTLRPEANGPDNTARYPSIETGGRAFGLYAREPPPFEDVQVAGRQVALRHRSGAAQKVEARR